MLKMGGGDSAYSLDDILLHFSENKVTFSFSQNDPYHKMQVE